MNMRALLALLLAVSPPCAAAAQTCFFDTECFETEACQPAAFELTTDGDPITAISTEFGNLEVVYVNGFLALAKGAGIVLALATSEEGVARASVLMEGPSAVTYVGRCETPPPAQVIQPAAEAEVTAEEG
jgi:hypothetical protein